MPLEITKSLRVFIILLITIFLSNTVYAGGMMAAEQLSSTGTTVEGHHHDNSAMSLEHDHHSHEAADQDTKYHSHNDQDVSNHCSKCTHCIACISAIPTDATQDVSLDLYQSLIGNSEFQYASIIIPLLQKPPISA
jgi:ferredoxin